MISDSDVRTKIYYLKDQFNDKEIVDKLNYKNEFRDSIAKGDILDSNFVPFLKNKIKTKPLTATTTTNIYPNQSLVSTSMILNDTSIMKSLNLSEKKNYSTNFTNNQDLNVNSTLTKALELCENAREKDNYNPSINYFEAAILFDQINMYYLYFII